MQAQQARVQVTVKIMVDQPSLHWSRAYEEQWWAQQAATLGMTLAEFDRRCGVIR